MAITGGTAQNGPVIRETRSSLARRAGSSSQRVIAIASPLCRSTRRIASLLSSRVNGTTFVRDEPEIVVPAAGAGGLARCFPPALLSKGDHVQ